MNEAAVRELYQRAIAARGSGGRDQCATPEAMLALVRREGPEEARLATLDHVMSCDACRSELELLRSIEKAGAATTSGVERSAVGLEPRGRDAARWRRGMPLALAASLLLAVGLAVRERMSGADDLPRGDGNDVVLVTPAAGADITTGSGVTFVWRSAPGARRYVLEILDASGAAVMTESTTDTAFTLPNASDLGDGTAYRWWVRTVAPGADQRSSPLRRLRVRSP